MRVTVLCGGPSAERKVSLVSGRAVAGALRAAGHDVYSADIGPDDLGALDRPADVIFPVLHGWFGESGELQAIMEKRRLAFVGSGSVASRLGMNKAAAKRLWRKAGLPTPPWTVMTPASWQRGGAHLPAPCVVKPLDSGSSIDVSVCATPAEARRAVERLLARHGRALVEKFINGAELTVGLLEERPLDPIRIITARRFFDYRAKYQDQATRHCFHTGLPYHVVQQCRWLACRAADVLGARDLSRVDIMVDRDMRPWLLEINTIPGFTPKSLLPEAARHAGIGFTELVDRLVKRAYLRHWRNSQGA